MTSKYLYIGLGILILAGIILFLPGFFKNTETSGQVIQDVDSIKIPLSDISKNARWYNFNSAGVEIRFFAVKDQNGNVKTAFDACDVCYRSNKGYSQKGGDMVCNNCENHYSIGGLGTRNLRGGGCWPGYLPSSFQGEYLVIEKSDLEKGRFMFS